MAQDEQKAAALSDSTVDVGELVQSLYDSADDPNSAAARLAEQLLSIRYALLASPSSLPAFLAKHYSPFSLYLLSRFSVEWLSRLDASRRDECFYFFFSSAFPASRVFLSIAASLRSRAATSSVSAASLSASVVLHVLDSFMRRQGMAELLTELAGPSPSSSASASVSSSGGQPTVTPLPPSATACLDSIASLPDLVANRLQSSVPPSLAADAFFTATLQSLPLSSPLVAPLTYLISKLCRLGHARLVFSCLTPPVFSQLQSEPQLQEEDAPTGEGRLSAGTTPSSTLSAVLLNTSSVALESALDALLWQLGQYVDQKTYSQLQAEGVLAALVGSAMRSSPTAAPTATSGASTSNLTRFLLTNKLLISRPVSHTASALILSLLFHLSYPASPEACQPTSPLFDDTLTAVARLWSSASFLHHATPPLQRSLTAALLHAFSLLHTYQHTYLTLTSPPYRAHLSSPSKSASDDSQLLGLFSSHPALLAVMEGVQLRMSEMEERRRTEGMRVAVEMSRLMDPTHVLKFDEDDADDREEREEEERKVKEDEQRRQRHEQHRQQLATTAQSGRPLHVYDLSENTSDLRKVPLPRYLRDALDMLRKQDERDNVQAALDSLDALIRSRPFDLADVAPELVGMLQQVATTVHCENKQLDAKRRAALVSVVVECPDVAAPLLIRSFHGQSLTLMGKVEALEVLVAAAEELSGKRTSKQDAALPGKGKAQAAITAFKDALVPSNSASAAATSSIPPAATSHSSTALTRAQHNDVITKRVESRTRRWGTIRQPVATFINRFAPVAHLFFFPLLGNLHDSGAWSSAQPVLSPEPVLLSHTLNTLSVLVILASPSAQSLDAMTAQLLVLLLTTRFHTSVTVRHMTLLSLLRVLLVLPTAVLIPTHGALLRELRVWVGGATSDEADDECRQLAVLCAGEMARVMQGLGEWELQQERRASAVKGLELIVPGAVSLTSPSSLRGSSSIKFL